LDIDGLKNIVLLQEDRKEEEKKDEKVDLVARQLTDYFDFEKFI